jgi:hypothetical protein
LTLSVRQVAAVLLEFRIKTVRHGLDEAKRVGKSQRATDAGIIGTRDPAAMFWWIVPENRIVSWSTMPMRARSERGS